MNLISFYKRKLKIIASRYFERPISFIERKRIERDLRNKHEIILIFSIGKVGSSSVYESLRNVAGLKIPVFHLHTLHPKRLKQQEEYYRNSKRNSVPLHLIQSKILSKILADFKGQIYILTLVREPIHREISSLFQDSFNFFKSQHIDGMEMITIVKEKLNALTDSLPEEEWFQYEMNEIFKIDINTINFNPEKGFSLKKKGNMKVAFIRLEDLDKCFTKVCESLFSDDYNFKLKKENRSEDKFYFENYKKLKNEIELEKKQVDRILQSKFVQKFYSDYTEIIRKRWQREYENSPD